MKMNKYISRRIAAAITVLLTLPLIACAEVQDLGADQGVIFAGPKIADERSKTFDNGNTLTTFKQRGVVLSDSSDSPWHEAAFLGGGSTLKDADGNLIFEVMTFETTDANGDITWSTLTREEENGPTKVKTVFGYGKWMWIVGEGEIAAVDGSRQDDHAMPRYSISWTIDPEGQKAHHLASLNPDDFGGYDKMYSFHGPHDYRETRTLANGLKLVLNDQAGVLVGETEGSPVYRSTFFTTTTEVHEAGDVTTHVGWGEFVDSDGDIIWIAGVAYYPDLDVDGASPIIGGTGKWAGITGVARFDGVIRGRGDDHNLVNWEIGYDLPQEGEK